MIVFGLLVLLVLGDAWVRLAPDDSARWHQGSKAHSLALQTQDAPDCATALARMAQTSPAHMGCVLPGPPEAVLARLDAIALAAPRTRRLAGAPEQGMITWVQRSRLMGFPDYVTAEATAVTGGTRLDVASRQRYGRGDQGVNARRLQDWLSRL